jgi:Pyridoxal-phosphate dependent enzyme
MKSQSAFHLIHCNEARECSDVVVHRQFLAGKPQHYLRICTSKTAPCSETTAMKDNHPTHRLSLANIARSADVIPPEFLNSPQYECEPLSEALGCRLVIKLDFTNPIRSFKGRGASFFVSEMLRGDGDRTRLLVCASAGN